MAYTPELLARVAELEALPWQKIEDAATAVGHQKPSGSSWKEQALDIAIAEFKAQDRPIQAEAQEQSDVAQDDLGEDNSEGNHQGETNGAEPEVDEGLEATADGETTPPESTAKDRFYADLGLKLDGPNQVPVPLKD